MNIKLVPVMAVAMALSFASCSEDEDNAPAANTGNQRTCYVQNIKESETGGSLTLSEEMIFDTNLRLTRIKNYNQSGVSTAYNEYTYNGSGQVIKQEYFSNGASQYYDTFEYDSQGRVIKMLEFNRLTAGGPFEQIGYETFEYNSANQLIKESDYLVSGELESYTTFEYTNGNVTRAQNYTASATGGFGLQGTTEYVYDDKRNPFKLFGIAIMDEDALSDNNPIKITNKDENNNVDQGDSYNVAYEYNSDGYPTKHTYTSFDNTDSYVRVMEFVCP